MIQVILFYLIKLLHIVGGQNAFIKQVNNRCLKILGRSAIMNPSVVQNQVHQKKRILFWSTY